MKNYVTAIIVSAIIFGCKRNYNDTLRTYDLVPESSTTIIQVNESTDFKSAIETNEILKTLSISRLNEVSKFLDYLNPKDELLIAYEDTKDSVNYAFISKASTSIFNIDSTTNYISEHLKTFNIEKTTIDDIVIYHKLIDSLFFGSTNLELVKDASTKSRNERIKDLITTTDNNKTASIILKNASKAQPKLFFGINKDSTKLTDYSVLDFEFNNTDLKYNGITKATDSTNSLINSFKNTNPQESRVIEMSPSSITALTTISFNDYSTFNSNLNTFKSKGIDSTTILNYTNEIGLISKLTNRAIILHSLNPEIISESITDKDYTEVYREIEILQFNNPEFFKTTLSPFIELEKANYFFIFDEFIVFSERIDFLKSIIADKLNNNTLNNSDAFKAIAMDLSSASSVFIYKNSEGLSDVLGKTLKGYNANAVQFIFDGNFAHVNGVIKKFKKRSASQSVTEAFSVSLNQDIISKPQTVKNHITKAYDITVQDVNNELYLISSNGSILWKKKLNGKILGEIEQMDIYKNGRLQLVFATPNRVYVIDRNGKDVSGFPLKFNDKITQPLSLFDYDNNKNYRLLVTQGKGLLMYDRNGKSISGFRYSKSQETISSQPKHFRISKKDYIVFSAGNKFCVLNRQGKTRVDVKDKIRFSGNAIYLYKSKFTTTNTLGQLVQIDTKGKISTNNLVLPENHRIDATSKTLVSLTDDKLNIKSRTVDLDFGDYTAPRIFYINDKIYISTTDRQSKKVYLYDSQAESIPNFPVFGTSSAELQELDKETGLELVTQSDSKTIIVYKLN